MKGVGAPHPAAMHGAKMPKMPKMSSPKMKMPTMSHVARPTTKIHPAGQMRVRLPQGEVDTKAGDPGVSAPGVGRF